MATSSDPKIAALQGKLSESTELMQSNLKLAVSRGEKLHDVELRAIQLEQDSDRFRVGSQRVRRMMCLRSWKWMAAAILGVIVLLVIIIVPIAVSAKK